MDSDTHKEFVEIKRDIRELRAGQDAEFHHNRKKYEDLLDEAMDKSITASILLEIDGFQSVREIEHKLEIPHTTCWRKIDLLLSKNIIFPSEDSKNGSAIYQQSRWFKQLRLEQDVRNKYLKDDNKGTLYANTEKSAEQN